MYRRYIQPHLKYGKSLKRHRRLAATTVATLALAVVCGLAAEGGTPTAAQAQGPAEPTCTVNARLQVTGNRNTPRQNFRIRFDDQCRAIVEELAPGQVSGAIDIGGTAQVARGSAPSEPGPSPSAAQGAIPAQTNTCVGIQTLRDRFGLPETEFRNKHTWTWDGFNVTSASYVVEAVPGPTGWQVVYNYGDYMGQTVPTPAIQLNGYSEFVFTGGQYRHQHEIDVLVEGDGYCTAYYYFQGIKPGTGSYVDTGFYIE